MQEILDILSPYKDEAYAEFCTKLTPGIPVERFIGIRSPQLRKTAKEVFKTDLWTAFTKELPHYYYEENMLHGLLISQLKDFNTCIGYLEQFLPYIDNWAVCDTLAPKVFQKNHQSLLQFIPNWINSDHVYTCRYGISCLMRYFLNESFDPEYLQLAASVHRDDYYVNMMIAWYFATALAKQWDAAIPYIEDHKLDPWIHSKTIQKAVESYRITDEQKAYLKTLRIHRQKKTSI